MVDITAQLTSGGIRAKADTRDNYSAGWKFAHWEQKGVPIRIEIGPKDLAAGQCVAVARRNGEKTILKLGPTLAADVSKLLSSIQAEMLNNARADRDSLLSVVTEWSNFVPTLDLGHMVLAPWCERVECEENIKKLTGPAAAAEAKAAAAAAAAVAGNATADKAEADAAATEASKGLTGAAKTLCIPFEQPEMVSGQMCFSDCGCAARAFTLWGRSY